MFVPDISEIASTFSHKSRAIILVSLLGGARTTSELAKAANIKPQTAIFHLNKLLDLNLIIKIKSGKYSYYKIDREDVANLIETLLNLSKEPKINSLKDSVRSESIKFARLCFNHIGGFLGTSFLEKLLTEEYLINANNLISFTTKGKSFFQSLFFNFEISNPTGKLCRDWSEKSYHLSGDLGYFFYKNLLDLNYIYQKPNSRELYLTELGINFFEKNFHLIYKSIK
ncbi:MAG: ArsR/SmtB family transcription factor [Sarcina sp.]